MFLLAEILLFFFTQYPNNVLINGFSTLALVIVVYIDGYQTALRNSTTVP